MVGNKKTNIMLFIFAFLTIFFISIILFWPHKTERKNVLLNNHTYNVVLAKTAKAHVQGLMFKKELAENDGMLFFFPISAKHSFWMKNTYISLDIIWFDTQKEVVHIAKNCQPCKKLVCESYTPQMSAKYVLELNAGTADKINLKIGDKISWE